MAKLGVHQCHKNKQDFCECELVSQEVIDIIKSIKSLGGEPKLERLTWSKLKCKQCGHANMLTQCIYGEAPGGKDPGYTCNAESDFAICPKCGHWAMIWDAFRTIPGQEI